MSALVHCFRCDDVVEASTDHDGPLWCERCDAEVLGPPSDIGDRSMRWSPSGLLLDGQNESEPATWRPRRSRGGSMLSAAMLGMYEVFYGPKDNEPQLEVIDDEPDDDDDMALHLDEDVPADSWIRFKTSS
jgi:hypothetical protein